MKSVCFTGHREIGGKYSLADKEWDPVIRSTRDVVERLIKAGYTIFYSGAALGFDRLGFYVVNGFKDKYPHIKNYLCIPFKGHDKMWSESDKAALQFMSKAADFIFYVNTIPPYDRANGKIHQMLDARNRFMVDKSDGVIALLDPSKNSGGTVNCVKYSRRVKKDIVVINPITGEYKREAKK